MKSSDTESDSDMDTKPRAKTMKPNITTTIQRNNPPSAPPTSTTTTHATAVIQPPREASPATTMLKAPRKAPAAARAKGATSRRKKAPISATANVGTTYSTPSRIDVEPGRDGDIVPNEPNEMATQANVLPSAPGETTARKKRKAPVPKIKVGANVLVRQDHLFTVSTEEQGVWVTNYPKNHEFLGVIKKGKSGIGYAVAMDIFPIDKKEVFIVSQYLKLAPPGFLEKTYDPPDESLFEINGSDDDGDELPGQEIPDAAVTTHNIGHRKRTDYQKMGEENFLTLGKKALQTVDSYDYFYGKDKVIQWQILQDGVNVPKSEDPMKVPTTLHYKKQINFQSDRLDIIFFDHFWPSVKGHGKLMDEYHSDPRSSNHATYVSSNFQFHEPDPTIHQDPDWKIKQCYLLMLAAVTESDVGVDNLWLKGKSKGRHNYANFGKYMPQNMFKMWQTSAVYMFCDNKDWYKNKRERKWSIIWPCLTEYNNLRRSLFSTVLLMLDESMSGWCPKTTPLGGAPNLTFEPRKPVKLGTQLKNGIECLGGCLAFQDIVQSPEIQKQKEFFFVNDDINEHGINLTQVKTSLPGNLSSNGKSFRFTIVTNVLFHSLIPL
jgi:hypothetical protein